MSDEEIDVETYDKPKKSMKVTPTKSQEPSHSCNTFGKNNENYDLSPEDVIDLKDCKTPRSNENFLKNVDFLTSRMSKFVQSLIENLRGLCITKLSEKSVNLMLKRYLTRLDEIKEQWQHNLHGEDFNQNLKGLLNILGGCFEEVLEKLAELLQKLKNFNSAHFHQVTNKGVLSTFSLVLQE
jgi:hypothetical protein